VIAFLEARIDEDEAALRAIEDSSEPWRGQWVGDEMNFSLRTRNGWSLARAVTVEGGFPPGVLAHIARHDPARVLREVEAKRAILDEHAQIPGDGVNFTFAEQNRAEDILLALAAVYSDHPDYDSAWAPARSGAAGTPREDG
jgi:hypothetical protein